jgi:hypothetical protein
MAEALPRVHGRTEIWDMMVRLGIEPGGSVLAPLALRHATAHHRCEACTCRPDCRAWLARAPVGASLAPRFCPSADILFELQFDQPGLRH